MADPFTHIESGTLDDSTKLDKGKNVKNFSGSSSSQIDWSQTKGVRQKKSPKEELKIHVHYLKKPFSHRDELPHVSVSGKSALSISNKLCKKLDLSGQGLTELSKDLGDFCKLEELNLSNNPLSHDISFFEHARFDVLKKLDLSGCGLTELPKDLLDFHKLEELNLSNNPCSHDTSFFKYVLWPELKKLDLSGCGLTELPKYLYNCYRLEELNLSNNPFSHDTSFFKYILWPELKKLDLSGCGLTELPKHLYYFYKLEEVNLSNNLLSHDTSFVQHVFWPGLRKLNLSGCGFTTLPEIMYYYPKLEELNLSNNFLSNVDLLFFCKSALWNLERLDLSGCGLTELPKDFERYFNVRVLNVSNNFFDRQDLLEKLNSGSWLSKLTHKIIFEDVVYIRSCEVWTVERRDVASTRYVSSTKERARGQLIQNNEIWLREFCHIRKSEKLTIESYYAMLQSLNIVCDLCNALSKRDLKREWSLSLNRTCGEILISFFRALRLWLVHPDIHKYVSDLENAVSWLGNWFSRTDDTGKLKHTVTELEVAFKKACEAFSKVSYTQDKIYAAIMMIISIILLNLTKPEAAVLRCLQSLQELHDVESIRVAFSVLDSEDTTDYFKLESVGYIAAYVLRINEILFKFVGMFLKPSPTVKQWPATIQLDEKKFNPLIDGRLLKYAGEWVWGGDEVKNLITDALQHSVPDIEEAVDNSITVDQTGGCFSLPEMCAFLLFPPDAVEHDVTLQCNRVKFKECVKPRDGETFVSRILKVEPPGVIFNKPVTVLLSHSLDEDEAFLHFYELIVENSSSTGWQELKTERISFIEDIPKEISKKEILEDHLPFAKTTIQEACTLVAATRATFNQILIPTNRPFIFSKQYGDSAELKITFPAGVTEKIMILNVQLFPADAVLNKEIRLNKSIVYAPIIRVSGQTTAFLKAVDVELIYSHADVLNIKEKFLPVGKNIQFTTKYGLLMQTNNETGSKDNWQALNENHDVLIERLRKDQLKFSFSVKHFSDVQPMVKTDTAVSFVPPESTSMTNMNNPACHHGIVLAVHKSVDSLKTLHAVLAPRHAKNSLSTEWKVKGVRFMSRLMADEPVYFCVPMSDVTESDHLPLKDYTLRFDPEEVSELVNNTDDDVDLAGREMRFLKDRECNNGENHTTQGDCRAKLPIHISESRSDHVDRPSAESREPIVDVESPHERRDVSSGAEDAQINNNQTSEVMMRRCELFETTVESKAQKKMEINKAFAEDPKGGKATKIVDVAGPTTTVIASIACGVTAAMSIPTFGAASFAAALVAGGTFLVKVVDKCRQHANAKEIEEVLMTAAEEAQISSYLNCVVKDVARELSRIFESQLFELQSDEQVKILAECVVELMFDLHQDDSFDRNTLLKKVLQDGKMKKKKILTRTKDIEWSAPNVFRKPGLRRTIFGKDGVEFKHFIKRNEAGKKRKYGYRGQFLEAKTCVSQNGEDKTAATDETSAIEDACKECCSIDEIRTCGHYFGESDIDACYTEPQLSTYSYNPLHILIQCPKFLESFSQLQEKKPSLVNFLNSKCHLVKGRLVRPVYRPHSPKKVSDLQNSDLTGCDFSHSDFTNSSLMKTNFTKCVLLFANLKEAKMSGSKFCDTLISHTSLEKLEADHCEWTKTSLLYSNVKGADLGFATPSLCGNCLDGTNINEAITGNNMALNGNKGQAQVIESGARICPEINNLATARDHDEGTSPIQSSVSDGEPSTSGNWSNDTRTAKTFTENMRNPSETTV